MVILYCNVASPQHAQDSILMIKVTYVVGSDVTKQYTYVLMTLARTTIYIYLSLGNGGLYRKIDL